MATTMLKKSWELEPIDLNVKALSVEGLMTLLGRCLFSLIFILSGFGHFSPQAINYAAQSGLNGASFFVPASGVLIIAGGLSVLLGYHARLGAFALIFFLVPTTLIMHRFWGVEDPMLAANQQAHFMKNLSLIGASFLICYFGAGPASWDAVRARKAKMSA